MTASRSCTTRVFLVFGMFFVCVLIGGALWGISSLLDRTERLYGKPDNGVGWTQRIVYAIDLIRYESDLLDSNYFVKNIHEFQIETG
ncbi:MAG: hypothetical protein K8R77_10615 [Anaerolineaceae bacterium]|nr:hypothetical protein [Anaerolineaceae bacterium]